MVCLLASARADEGLPFDFKPYSTPEGLPNGMIHQVYQDRDGFIWIASYYGLFRYDGYEVRSFKSNLYTPKLLLSNNVVCVGEDLSHGLWIGTHEGVCVYDKVYGTMKSLPLAGVTRQRVNAIHVAADSTVFLGTIRGMARYDVVGDSLVLLTSRNSHGDVPHAVNIQALLEDEQGNLLIGTWQEGLFYYDRRHSRFHRYDVRPEVRSVLSLYRDSRGVVWVGTNGQGLFQARFSSDRRQLVLEHVPSSASDYIYSISEDLQTHTLWLATRAGVRMLSLVTEGGRPEAKWFFPTCEVSSVMRDRDGLMWAGTKGAGVFRADTHPGLFSVAYPNERHTFQGDYVSALCVDDEGALWVGLSAGIDYVSGDVSRRLLSSGRPTSIYQSPSTGHMLLGVQDDGLSEYAGNSPVARHKAGSGSFLPSNLIFSIYEDRRQNLWVGTYKGLGVRYHDGRTYVCTRSQAPDPLLCREITAIAEDNDGSLWLLTRSDGVLHLKGDMEQPERWTCRHYTAANGRLPVNAPLCLHQDHGGRIWLGTEGSGLCLYEPSSDRFVSVHKPHHLPGDMVGSIQEDAYGHLWLGTNQGLARLSITGERQGHTRVFTVADGLPDNFFIPNASFLREGRLYFGCSRGVVSFTPSGMDGQSSGVPLCLTDIRVDGRSLGQYPVAERARMSACTPEFTERLIIPAGYGNFSLSFASLTYHASMNNRYAYRLLGADDGWRYVEATNRTACYTRLEPGKYVFELRGSNENGDWGAVRRVDIVVEAPWWATGWAYALYAVLGLTVAGAILWEVRRRIVWRNRLHWQEMENCKIQELNHVKLQFFTNITHELMTPLTILSASVDELGSRYHIQDDLRRVMAVNIRRLIRLLQQILEFRKAESGNLKLQVSCEDLAAFVRAEVESFAPLVRERRQHLSAEGVTDVYMACFDRDKLDKIMYNLLSNAAKYNREEAHIRVTLAEDECGGRAVITVEDDGEGIPKERQADLFKRFYEGDYRRFHTTGTGIGLSLVHDLVELHHGSIRVESATGQGTRFVISLPTGLEAYADDERVGSPVSGRAEEEILDRGAYESSELLSGDEYKDAPVLLVVEDNEELLAVMARLLGHDYRVLKAANGVEALRMLAAEEIDLVISDVVMPDMDGYALTKAIKQSVEMCHVPVILLTARRNADDQDLGYEAGADAYLTKPFNLSALHARIKRLLQARARTVDDFQKQFVFELKELHYTGVDEKFLQDAVACVDRHLGDAAFDISGFVAEMAVSRATLHKKLKSLTGLNTTGFVRNIRLKAACRMMEENPSIRISELAYLVGFNDPKYFSLCFKKEFGMQPSEYCERYAKS